MSSKYTTPLQQLRTYLEANTTRVVSRALRLPEQQSDAELDAGIYILLSSGVSAYPYMTSEGETDRGLHQISVVFQARAPESAGDDAGELIDALEFEAVDEIEQLFGDNYADRPEALYGLRLESWSQSAQRDAPFAWVVFKLINQE